MCTDCKKKKKKTKRKKIQQKTLKKKEYFKYTLLAAIHHQESFNNPERTNNINLFLLSSFKRPSLKKDWQKFEKKVILK